jgi:uncharacterized membrane protein YhhN
MFYITACIFIIVSAVHLTGCIIEKKKLCTVTKPLLMPLLALTATTVLQPYLPGALYTLIFTVTALAWGTAGDVFLLFTDEKHFTAGALCFLAGHLFWIAQYSRSYSAFSLPETVIGIVSIAAFLSAVYFMLGRPKGVMGGGIIVYGAVLCTLVLTGTAAVCAYSTLSAGLYLAGALFFLVSDSMLGFSVMKKQFPLSHFLIMITYIAAQTLLTAAVVLPWLQQHV